MLHYESLRNLEKLIAQKKGPLTTSENVRERCEGFAADGRFHALLEGAGVSAGHIVVVTTESAFEIRDDGLDFGDDTVLQALVRTYEEQTIIGLSPIGQQ